MRTGDLTAQGDMKTTSDLGTLRGDYLFVFLVQNFGTTYE